MVIVSKNNPQVKELSSLKEKKGRRERGAFLVEGEKMVRECVRSGMKVLRLAVREGHGGDTYSLPCLTLGDDAFRAVCDEKTPQSIVAEVEIPSPALRPPKAPCLLLDGVSDPANVGAIIRTAVASGYGEIYLASCADPFAPKSVRASMSGVFFATLYRGERAEILSALEGVELIAADMDGENVFRFEPPARYALCIGNEGNGLSEEVARLAKITVRIPMDGRTESLNASVAAGIFMYLFKKKTFEGL